jgi:hypothetical protein
VHPFAEGLARLPLEESGVDPDPAAFPARGRQDSKGLPVSGDVDDDVDDDDDGDEDVDDRVGLPPR